MQVSLSEGTRNQLLNDLCVKLGFCLPMEGRNRILDDPPEYLDEFVDLIYEFEGLNPETADLHVKRMIRDMIIKAHHQTSQGAA